jgi:outer membrane lipoprotein-sorting protein
MKALKKSLLTAVMLVGGLNVVMAQSADEIMAKHEKAMGGMDNWNKVKTVKMVGSMSQQGMEIGITQTLDLGKASRMDISLMGMTGYQIVTENEGWMYMPFAGSDKVEPMKPDMIKASKRQLDIKGNQLLDYKLKGTKAELAGKDTINSALVYKIKLTDKEGKESICYIDASTFYILRHEMKMMVQDQEQEIAIDYKDYKKTPEGIVMPMSVSVPMMGGTAEIVYKTVDINKPIDPSVFKPEQKK